MKSAGDAFATHAMKKAEAEVDHTTAAAAADVDCKDCCCCRCRCTVSDGSGVTRPPVAAAAAVGDPRWFSLYPACVQRHRRQ